MDGTGTYSWLLGLRNQGIDVDLGIQALIAALEFAQIIVYV